MPGGQSGIWRISPAKRYPTRPRKIFQGCRTLFQSPPDRPNPWPHESDQRSPQESEAAAARRSHRPRSARSRRRDDHPAGAAAQCEIAGPDFSRSGRPRRAFGGFYRLPRQPRGSAAAKSYEHKAARAENRAVAEAHRGATRRSRNVAPAPAVNLAPAITPSPAATRTPKDEGRRPAPLATPTSVEAKPTPVAAASIADRPALAPAQPPPSAGPIRMERNLSMRNTPPCSPRRSRT